MFIEEDVHMESFWVQTAIGAIKIIAMVYDIITMPIYLILQRPWKRRALAKRVKAKVIQQDATSITYRGIDPPNEMHIKMLQNDINTLERMFNFVTKVHSTKRCIGTRKIISEEDEVQPNGRVFKKFNMGDYMWRNFIETEHSAACFGRGLRELGMEPRQNIVIFAETRAEWLIAAHGCFKQNMPLVTIYATLGDEGITHGIKETEVTTVITSHELLPKFKTVLAMTPNVKKIIFMEDQLQKTETTGFKEGVEIIPFSRVVEMGEKSKMPGCSPTPDDTAIIMYTSGSTGTPKGVLLSHANCIGTMKNFCDIFKIYPDDVLIGFLPLAHVFELLAESVCLLTGIPIGYSTPLTLIDSSSKIMRGCKGDASVLKPTCMTSVPLILDRISKGINAKVNAETPMKKAFFKFAYKYKSKWVARGFQTPILDRILFKKIARLLGGRIRSCMSGGAPLAPDTHEQISLCLCVDMIQGYGLTETTAGATVTDKWCMEYSVVGAPCSSNDIRLINWEEGNYRVTNKPYPQGEIVIGGTTVSKGYYKLPGKTEEEFFEEDGQRWFRTGDVGEVHHDGVLKIIDRKKDLVKLQAGEYVSLGKVESELKTCPVVENICVYGDSTKQHTVALVVPNPQHLEEIAERQGIKDMEFEQLCSSPVMEKAVVQELADHGKKCKLHRFEIPTAVTLCKDIWTPDMGLVTAAFKLKRKDILERYKNEISRMYAS
ncbi:long-chain-fatty-acid--CoA ligase 4 isoform X1 [Wyeomyia smithii]|uniref:long-chain-fatty-acid--CoA ligase 4 isoform X1 n=2 Tax=Wyeomyia smithii TaxID=174621 RepID=UPI0024680A07|nr:long-chain-fatty-acid--CoA ligase 4 isoform X1 [Wyeomyia smithii]XP_055542074.1 long-chain-fatty-acid--CoA ligase 4 isoform X1 [Wyeomyia smithii]